LNVDCSLQEGELLLLSLLSTVRKIGIFRENQAVLVILQLAQGVNILHTFSHLHIPSHTLTHPHTSS